METRPPHSAALVLLGMAALAIVTGVAPTTAPIDVAPGLMLSIESGATRDARVARLAALRVPQDAAPTPLVPPGPFRATFSGYINLKIRGQYSFGATGRGTVKVMVNDAVALDARGDFAGVPGAPVKLTKGKNRILIEYAGPKSGDAELRLLWSSKEFPPEPVSPAFLTHDANDALLVRQTAVRAGRELFAHLRCIKCHVADDKPGPSAMPELSADAPDLTDVGARVNRDWMAAWIENPRAIRPDSSMPRVVSSPQQAADVAAYLATPGTSGESVAGNGDANAGARLFLSLGCIACHAAPDAATIDREHQRIPLGFVRAKYNPAALAQYLARPDAHYSWTRMPDFHLSGDEVSALCAYLLARCPPDVVPSVVAGDPARGKTLFQQAGCLNCHSGPGASQHKSPPLAELKPSHGCLTENPDQRAAAPDFALNTSQRDALKQFLASDRSALNRDDRGEFALRQIAALRCTACHTLDSRPDTWSGLTDQIAAIESQLPPVKDDQQQYAPDQTLPILTWTGEKLRVDWMSKFLAGQIKYKPRPWIKARMPAFASRAQWLAEGLAAEHGVSPEDPAPRQPDAELARVGRKLLGRDGGFSCISCHAVADVPALSPFEAPAPNFIYTTARLRKDYYDRWMRAPLKVEPGTRMPQFTDIEGKSSLKQPFDGDANKQFDAMWEYLLSGADIRPP